MTKESCSNKSCPYRKLSKRFTDNEEVNILSDLINLLLAQRCLVCKAECGDYLCTRCHNLELTNLQLPRCSLCFKPHSEPNNICLNCTNFKLPWKTLRYLSDYSGNVRDIISTMKYKPSFHLAEFLRYIIEQNFEKLYPQKIWDLVLAMPISDKSLQERGFNQAEILSEAFSADFHNILCNKKARRQSQLKGLARFKNAKGSFFAKKNLQGAEILLVDDVLTSGASAYYATQELYRAGAETIHLFTFAKSASFERSRIYLHKLLAQK